MAQESSAPRARALFRGWGSQVRKIVCAGLAAFALPALTGCGSGPEAPAPEDETTAIIANPDMPEGISVSGARLALPAVSGNPAAVYFTVVNASATDMAVVSASVEGAGTTVLHKSTMEGGTATMAQVDDVPVPAGEEAAFAPGGLHVMAMELGSGLEKGREVEVTITFANGDKASFPAAIVGPGDAGEPAR